MYGILIVGPQPRDWERPTKDFKNDLEKDAASAGLRLFLGGPPVFSSDRPNELEENTKNMQ
jgi:hypothetical protein